MLLSNRKISSCFPILVLIIILKINLIIAAESEPIVIPLWPDDPAINTIHHNQAEKVENREIDHNALGLNRAYSYVSKPEMTVHLPDKKIVTGVAVVIFPGGGGIRVVIDKEGHDIAKMLNKYGIAGIVVKYRTFPDDAQVQGENKDLEVMRAIISDGLRAVRLVRLHAAEWSIDPNKIGVMGFSAGGHLATSVSTHWDKGNPHATEPVEKLSCRPDFMAPIYPAVPENIESLVTQDTPPAFIVATNDDKTTPADNSIDLYLLLRSNNIPAELHIYTFGGHGFGLGVKGGAVTSWPERFIDWLAVMQFLNKN